MKIRFIIFSVIFFSTIGYAQTPEQNMMKYWKHRNQLSQFVWIGEGVNATTEHGSYVVAAFKRPWGNCSEDFELGHGSNSGMLDSTNYYSRCGGLKFGADATIQLGWYVGVLATEYRLAKNHSFPTAEIERDLWSALEAYERLDRMAEGLYDGYEPELNGFFIRDDIMPNFADGKLKPDGSPYFEGVGCSVGSFAHGIAQTDPPTSHQNRPLVDPWDVTVDNGVHYRNTPSADQVVALMLGFALVKACVDEEATYNGESILAKAQQYAHLMARYGKETGDRDGWQYKDPRGNNIEDRSNLHMYSSPIAKAAEWISGYQHEYYGEATTNWDPLWDHMTSLYANTLAIEEDVCALENLLPGSFFLNGVLSLFVPGTTIQTWTHAVFYAAMIMSADDENMECFNPTEPSTLSVMLTAAAISNDWNYDNLRNVKAREWGMEIFPLISDVLYNRNDISAETKAQCKQMIDIAPCDKFCACTHLNDYNPNLNPCDFANHEEYGCIVSFHCDPVSGWESMQRYTHRDDQSNSVWGIESPGLDFMLLYNCYHLKYPRELPSNYGNNYVGDYEITGNYPKPVVYMPEFLGNVNCTACEESPTVFMSNDVIESNAQIGSIEGYYAPTLPLQSPNDPVTPATFVGNVTYRAGREIRLTDGFSVTNGATFHAYIDPFECENGMLMRLGEEENILDAEEDKMTPLPQESAQNLVVYPNPNNGSFVIESYKDIVFVELYSSLGQRYVVPPQVTNNRYLLSGFSSGMYILKVGLEDGSLETHKLIINQ